MKNKAKYLLAIIVATISIIASSCSEKFKFWDISEFNISENALKDSQQVKILYYSNGPGAFANLDNQIEVITTFDKEGNEVSKIQLMDFYLHYVVFEVDTKDTFNILSYENIGITLEDKEHIFYYTNATNNMSALSNFIANNKDATIEELKEFDQNTVLKFNKVARDPQFDRFANNNYPTVIGRMLR